MNGLEVVVHDMAFEGRLMPPPPGVCQQCAVDHEPEVPHDNRSLFWQYWFYGRHHEWPTWSDAMAHCDHEMRVFWRAQLANLGVSAEELGPAGMPGCADD